MINEVIVIGQFNGENGFIVVHGKKYLQIQMLVEKAFVNSEGDYEKDCIECLLWKGEADRLLAMESESHWMSIKGRLETYEDKMYVVAEKIKYLDSMINR